MEGPLEVSYNTSGSSGRPGSVSLKEDNNSDDSTASNPTISASITDLSNTSAIVINTSTLEGDTENVYSISDYSWYSVDANNNRTLLQSGTTNNLELTVNSAQNILLSTTYLDGELNQKTVESNTLSVDQVNIDNSIASLRFTIGSYHGRSWQGTVYLSANVNGSVLTTTVYNASL